MMEGRARSDRRVRQRAERVDGKCQGKAEGGGQLVCDGEEGRTWRDRARQGRERHRAGQGSAGQGRAGESRVGKGEGNAKDNAGHSALQEKAKGITDCAQGGRQHRADYKK